MFFNDTKIINLSKAINLETKNIFLNILLSTYK